MQDVYQQQYDSQSSPLYWVVQKLKFSYENSEAVIISYISPLGPFKLSSLTATLCKAGDGGLAHSSHGLGDGRRRLPRLDSGGPGA